MISFYRKYRPQKVKELDLTQVREFMEGVLVSGKFSHAYLFSGPKGTGKTSAARILAKTLNCKINIKSKKGFNEACGKCVSCIGVVKGSSMSVVEMDAASNRGIDDIRSLREKIGMAPVEGKYTIYIVDEVHMLTAEAFNALLKTLEEPPEHAVFVLCTTEPGKLPGTIISRCTRLNFSKASEKEVERSLKKVIKGESLKMDSEALKSLAQSVDGSFRDGMKVLEQLAQVRRKITVDQVKEELGRGKGSEPDELLKFVVTGDIKKAIAEIDRLSEQGVDWQRFIKELLEQLRGVLRAKVGVGEDEEKQDISRLEIEWLIDLMSKSALEMKSALITELPLEMAAMEFCLARQNSSVEYSIPSIKKDKTKTNDVGEQPSKVVSSKKLAVDISFQMIKEGWNDLLLSIKPHNHSLEALLKATRPVKCEGEWVVLEVYYKFHKERLEQERYRKIIEQEMQKMFSLPIVRLRYELGAKRPSVKEKAHENVTAKVEDEEIVKAAEEIFGA